MISIRLPGLPIFKQKRIFTMYFAGISADSSSFHKFYFAKPFFSCASKKAPYLHSQTRRFFSLFYILQGKAPLSFYRKVTCCLSNIVVRQSHDQTNQELHQNHRVGAVHSAVCIHVCICTLCIVCADLSGKDLVQQNDVADVDAAVLVHIAEDGSRTNVVGDECDRCGSCCCCRGCSGSRTSGTARRRH